jgi:hypothetical protein
MGSKEGDRVKIVLNYGSYWRIQAAKIVSFRSVHQRGGMVKINKLRNLLFSRVGASVNPGTNR